MKKDFIGTSTHETHVHGNIPMKCVRLLQYMHVYKINVTIIQWMFNKISTNDSQLDKY